MTEIISIAADNVPAVPFLEPYFQSGHLNFLIGSGASFPAIKTAGTIETDINDLMAANKETEANQKSLEFITASMPSTQNSRPPLLLPRLEMSKPPM